jgi:hypothetical protein
MKSWVMSKKECVRATTKEWRKDEWCDFCKCYIGRTGAIFRRYRVYKKNSHELIEMEEVAV